MLSPVLLSVFVIEPLPVNVLPVMFATAKLVQVNTVFVTSEVGVKFNWSPLQIVATSGRLLNTGVGLTITLEVVITGVQPLPLAVNVYTTVCGVLVVLSKVSVMVPVDDAALGFRL